MKMGIRRDQPVDGARNAARETARADCLAILKAPVLAHIGKIWGYEPYAEGAELAGRVGCDKKRNQLGIGAIQRADEHDVAAGNLGTEPQIGLTVRKSAGFDPSDLAPEQARESNRELAVTGQRQEHRRGHRSDSSRMGPTASA